jgi:hypothetical protein
MTRRWTLPVLLVLAMTSTRAAGPTIAIDAASPSGKVSPLFYGPRAIVVSTIERR